MNAPAIPPVATVNGYVDESARELAEVFSRAVARSRGGAQLTLLVGGKKLLDVHGGTLQHDTPVQVFSVSKAVVALAAAHAFEAGLLDLDAPVASYWPAMAKTSTATITPRMILEHSSGISAVSVPLSADDLLAGALDRAVEEQEPLWEPGTEHGYGAFTFGALMNGAFQHALGKSIAEYVAENLTGPTGHNFWFGAPDDKLSQVAPLGFEFPILTADHAEAIMSGRAINDGSFIPILSGAPFFFGDPRVIQANFPSLSGVSTASDLAHLFAAVTGVASATRILSPAALSELARERRNGMDRTLYHVSRFGSGVELPHVYSPMLGGDSFGHQGAGGSVIVVDPVRDVVVSYVCTQTQQTVGASDASLVLMGAINQWLAQR